MNQPIIAGMQRRTAFLIFLVSTLSTLLVTASTQRSSIDEYRAIPQSLAPAEILRQITALKQQRVLTSGDRAPDALDIYVAQLWQSLRLPNAWNGGCGCNALLLEEDAFARFVTLRIGNGGWDYRFVVFFSPWNSKDSWRLVGHADTESKYAVPSYRIESNPVGAFLVTSESSGGSGVFRENEVWYELNPGTSRQVLKYPRSGNDSPFFRGTSNGRTYLLSREWQATRQPPQEKDISVTVDLTVRYSIEDEKDSELFTRKQTAVFQWDAPSRTYKLDAKNSSVTEEELNTVYDFDKLTIQKFIEINLDQLRKSPNRIAADLLRQRR
jgi:hypothetical protein